MSHLDLSFDPANCLIGGKWVRPANGEMLPLYDPSYGTEICHIARGSSDDIDAAVAAARAALDSDWGRTTAAERGRILARIGHLVRGLEGHPSVVGADAEVRLPRVHHGGCSSMQL